MLTIPTHHETQQLRVARTRRARLRAIAVAVLIVMIGVCCATASPSDAVFRTRVRAKTTQDLGSAVCIHPDGWLLTTGHVIGSGPVEVLHAGKWETVSIHQKPTGDRVSLLKASSRGWPSVRVSTGDLRVGDSVTVIGYPAGSFQMYRTRVTSTGAYVGQGESRANLTGLAVQISSGTSGGGAFNSAGELCGIAVYSSGPSPRGPPKQYVRIHQRSAGSVTFVHSAASVREVAAWVPVQKSIPKPHLRAWVMDDCRPCANFKRDLAAGRFSRYEVEVLNIRDPKDRKIYDDTIEAIKAAGGKVETGIPAFHLAGHSELKAGYGREGGWSILIGWIESNIMVLPKLFGAAVDRGKQTVPVPPPPQVESPPVPKETSPTPTHVDSSKTPKPASKPKTVKPIEEEEFDPTWGIIAAIVGMVLRRFKGEGATS